MGEKILPFKEAATHFVEWDELDREEGMTAAYLDGTEPAIGVRPGSKTHRYEPLDFKETDVIRNRELLRARELGTLGQPVDLTALVGRAIKARMDKNRIRAEKLRWDALQGGFDIDENGVKVSETFPVQFYDAIVDWDDFDNAKPLQDWGNVADMFLGTGATSEMAVCYGTRKCTNYLLRNANQKDLAGHRGDKFRNVTWSIAEANQIIADQQGLSVATYNLGYWQGGLFKKFINDDVLIVVGYRGGEPVGDMCMTPTFHRQKNGQPAPGMYAFIEVNGQSNRGSYTVSAAELGAGKNPRIEVTGGFSGGPRLVYPKSVIVMRIKH
jgi:hypothetical protein